MYRYELVPKTRFVGGRQTRGCSWFSNNPFGSEYVRVFSKDGEFETIVRRRDYFVIRLW